MERERKGKKIIFFELFDFINSYSLKVYSSNVFVYRRLGSAVRRYRMVHAHTSMRLLTVKMIKIA